jgi:signal transduction histidine kinase
MKLLSSLRSRIFLASAVLAILCIAVAIYLVGQRVTEEAERTLERDIVATGEQIDQLRAVRAQTFTLMARLIADLPKLKAAIDTNDPPTVQDIARGYQSQLNASLVLVTNRRGDLLYTAGGSPRAAAIAAHQPAVREALAGKDTASLLPQPNGILQMVTVPVDAVTRDRPRREILGTLSVAFLLDDTLLAELKRMTGSDVAFGMDGQILASTLRRDLNGPLAGRLRASGISRVSLDGAEYEVLSRPLAVSRDPDGQVTGPVALIMRSRTEQLRSLQAIHTGLFATAVVAVLLATVLSFAVARTIAQPLAAITDVMREVAATGDLTRKIALRHRNRWDDEDARLLANTFNTLTDNIAKFQREMSQKERLTALGRLSTVIAHEVRNPLMIIKASLHALKGPDLDQSAVREAARDIEEEVARLNGIVNEVLDFARPIRFDVAPADLNEICRSAAAAARASEPGVEIETRFDAAVGLVKTDAERLRIALVNMLVNAQHAMNGAGRPGRVTFSTQAAGTTVVLVIADRGLGIPADAVGQIFDPYFTTKRGGTGLGLPIAKNIIEGLGGAIAVWSTAGVGTELRIELPADSSLQAAAVS